MKKITLVVILNKIAILIIFLTNIFSIVGNDKLYAQSQSADVSIEKEVLIEKSTIRNYMKSFVFDSLKYSSHKKNGYEIYTLFLIEEKQKNEIKIECFNENDVLVDVKIKQKTHDFLFPHKITHVELYKIETNNYLLKRIEIYSFNKIKRISINGMPFEEYNKKFIDSFIQEINDKEIEITYKKSNFKPIRFCLMMGCMFVPFLIFSRPNNKQDLIKNC